MHIINKYDKMNDSNCTTATFFALRNVKMPQQLKHAQIERPFYECMLLADA